MTPHLPQEVSGQLAPSTVRRAPSAHLELVEIWAEQVCNPGTVVTSPRDSHVFQTTGIGPTIPEKDEVGARGMGGGLAREIKFPRE